MNNVIQSMTPCSLLGLLLLRIQYLKTQYCPLRIARLRSLAAIFLMLKNLESGVRL